MPTKLRQRRQEKALLSAQGKINSGETLTNRENKALNLSLSQNKPSGTYQGERKAGGLFGKVTSRPGTTIDTPKPNLNLRGVETSTESERSSSSILTDPNKIGIPTVGAAASSDKPTGKTYTGMGDTVEDFAQEVNKLNPTSGSSSSSDFKWKNVGTSSNPQMRIEALPGETKDAYAARTKDAYAKGYQKPTDASSGGTGSTSPGKGYGTSAKEHERFASNKALHERLTKESQTAADAGTEVKTPGIQNIKGELSTYNPTSQQYEGGTRDRSILSMGDQVSKARNSDYDLISGDDPKYFPKGRTNAELMAGGDIPELAPPEEDIPNIDTGDDKIGRIEPKGVTKIDTDTKPRDIQTSESSGGSTSTMPELDTGPGTYQGGGLPSESGDTDVSTDLTKNASTATTGDDSAGGSGNKKTKKKKGKGLIGKTTNVASTKSSNVSAGSGGAGSTTGYSTRGIPSVFTGNTMT